MGLDTSGSGPTQAKLLNSQPNWDPMKSHVVEIFEDRYHTCLIGAAYHAELASEEHRWRRLKQLVRPYVDDTVATCVQLIQAAWGSLEGLTTFEDARSCRETMKAYSKEKSLKGIARTKGIVCRKVLCVERYREQSQSLSKFRFQN